MYDPTEVRGQLDGIAASPGGDVLLALVVAAIEQAEAAVAAGETASATVPLGGMQTEADVLWRIGSMLPVVGLVLQAISVADGPWAPRRELDGFGNDPATTRIMDAAVAWCATVFRVDPVDEARLRYHYDWVRGLVNNDPMSRQHARAIGAAVDLDRVDLPEDAVQRLAPRDRAAERRRRAHARKHGSPPPGMTWNI